MRCLSPVPALCLAALLASGTTLDQERVSIPAFDIDYSYLSGDYTEVPVRIELVVLRTGEPFFLRSETELSHNVVQAIRAAKFQENSSDYQVAFTFQLRTTGTFAGSLFYADWSEMLGSGCSGLGSGRS